MRFRLTRRRLLAGSLAAGAGLLGAGTWIDMRYVEPQWLKETRVNICLPGKTLSRPVRVLHLSDLHASGHVPMAYIEKAIERGIAHKPDLVCFTGDLINRLIPDRKRYAAALRLLSDDCPCYACAGNHDGGSWARAMGGYPSLDETLGLFGDANIRMLFNASETVSLDGVAVELVGLGDYWANDTRPEEAFPPAENQEALPRIVLSHNPDSKGLLSDYAWDLMLCGHTHGGQLSLPLVGTPFAPVRDHRYVYGLNSWEGRWIHTTSGVGNLHGMRLNCRPEVAILDIS